MNTVPLGSLITPARSVRAGEGAYPVLSITMHEGLVFQQERFKKTIAGKDLSSYKVVNRGQLVVGFPIDEAVLDFQEITDAGIVSPAYGVWDVVDREAVDSSYLGKYLRSPQAISYYKLRLRGTTARRRSLTRDTFEALPVPLPPISEQQRIAEILDQSQSLINDSLILEEKSETLLKASFIAAFGHPLDPANPINRQRVGAVSKVITGNTPPRKDPSNYGSTVEWLKSDNLGGLQPTPAAELLSDVGARKARLVEPGATLITCIAGSRESIGKSSLLDRTAAFNQQINAIVPGEELDPLFLFAQVKTAPELIRREATDGMKGIVSKKTLESVKILVPSVHAQRQFSEAATKFMSLKDYTQRRTSELRTLHESLSTRAFAGQL